MAIANKKARRRNGRSATRTSPSRGPQSSRSRSPTHPLIRKIGLRIHRHLFENKKPVEWLAFQSGVARSSIREIIAGRSNPRILTLDALARAMGFQGIVDFLNSLGRESEQKG